MSRENHSNDPDTYLIESSVPDVRALELKTRHAIEAQKQELRAMVGNKYQDLISAADTIITMSKNAQAIKTNFERMQTNYDVQTIKANAKKALELRDQKNNSTIVDTKRRYVYCIAALVKSLADVPEQMWHAMENHRYLHASRLFVLAEKVYDYLEQEKQKSFVDIEVAFPVIQRQWDAVSAFKQHIIQRSLHYLCISEQTPEHLAEIMVGLMLLDNMSYQDTLQKMLDMRLNVIREIIQQHKTHRLSHQLKEITTVFKRTLIQTFSIFVPTQHTSLIESFVASFQQTFLIPSKSSHGNETPSQPAITRLFSPSSNVHLMVRYLPDTLQTYLPVFDPSSPLTHQDVQAMVRAWTKHVEQYLQHHLSQPLAAIQSHADLVQLRTQVFESLEQHDTSWQTASDSLLSSYSIWHGLYRDTFNAYARSMVDTALNTLAQQPQKVWQTVMEASQQADFSVTMHVWPDMTDQHHHAFRLPHLSSAEEIKAFTRDLAETVHDRTNDLHRLQDAFDTTLARIRKDIQVYLSMEGACDTKEDTETIKTYFENQCLDTVMAYAYQLQAFIERIAAWTDQNKINHGSIFLGRLAKNIGCLSKELPKALSVSLDTMPVFELRSRIHQDLKYTQVQDKLLYVYHQSHTPWLDWLEKKFAQDLESTLVLTKWNDTCPSITVWENVEQDIKIPTQSTNDIVKNLYFVCEEIQRINSTMIDQTIMTQLREKLLHVVNRVYQTHMERLEMTENGALQLIFDYLFLSSLFEHTNSTVIQFLKQQVDPINWASYEYHLKSQVNKFYIRQSLILGVLTHATHETYER
ncbi:uncharacterized protein B0P05DRAFT_552326 [Gilbertella persicaria]|uniref:uncharacterized protein n=1 Tax=Gilbertella persicaria TaxID=101096 RepID=UPI0022210D41|nr:uncharacterized protein B0P05DRAFT_552326 [Gilbertella persicaria]KAI8067633.1 hypothetical protein B0P05DRAFT_552326 [Gilbertella persicaria]